MSLGLKETAPATGQLYKVLAAIMLGGIMGTIDASIVNVILPIITVFLTPLSRLGSGFRRSIFSLSAACFCFMALKN